MKTLNDIEHSILKIESEINLKKAYQRRQEEEINYLIELLDEYDSTEALFLAKEIRERKYLRLRKYIFDMKNKFFSEKFTISVFEEKYPELTSQLSA